MEKPTGERWGCVVHFSVVFAMFMCLILGIVGYISFTGYTQGNDDDHYNRDYRESTSTGS
jgi:sodium-coupled neutral amino acid transporter 11